MKFRSTFRPVFLLAGCLAGCLAVTGLIGCAAVDQKIGLNYSRPDQSLVRHSGDIAVSRMPSSPSAKNGNGEWIIGSLNNVHGVHQADLLSDRSPEEWISEALIEELRQAGYSVAFADPLPAAAARGLSITGINNVMTVNKGTFSSDTRLELSFNVEVYLKGDRAKTFTVAAHDDRTVPLSASRKELEKIMLQSLQDAMHKLIPDIITLIDRK